MANISAVPPGILGYEKASRDIRRLLPYWIARSSLALLALSIAMVLMSSCASIKGPRVPAVFVIDKESDSRVLTEVKNYRDGKCLNDSTKDCKPDRSERDTIIYDLKMIIDRSYENYAGSFERTEDTAVFLGETSAASLTAVATLVGLSPTKDILTTASTLVQSTSVSAQKNYYQKQTSYAILNVMDSQRAKNGPQFTISWQTMTSTNIP